MVSGELVRVSILDLDYASQILGAGSIATNRNAYPNGDHTGAAFNLNLPSGIPDPASSANYAALYMTAYGPTIGFRFRNTALTNPFGIIIDGTPYEPVKLDRYDEFDNQGVSGLGANKDGVFFVTNLPNKKHSVAVVIWPDASVAKSLVFHGLILEKSAGYIESKSLDSFFGGGTLTASAVAVPTTDMSGAQNRGIKKIIYRNTDTLPHVVTVSWNSVVVSSIYLTASGTDGDTKSFDISSIGINPGTSPNITHQADTAAKVTFVCIGVM